MGSLPPSPALNGDVMPWGLGYQRHETKGSAMQRRLNRKVRGKFSLAVAIAVCASIALTPTNAYAATSVDIEQFIEAQYPYSNINYPVGASYKVLPDSVNIAGVTVSNVRAVPDQQNFSADSSPIYSQNSFLENSTDIEQVLWTQSYSRSIWNTTSTTATTTNTMSTNLSYTMSVKWAWGGISGTHGVTSSHESSDSTTKTNSKVETYSIPSQGIKVPAYTTASVTAVLWGGKSSGTYSYYADLAGNYKISTHNGHWSTLKNWDNPLYKTILWAQDGIDQNGPALPPELSLNKTKNVLVFRGRGTYSATFGTTFGLQVCFVNRTCPTSTSKMIRADVS
ncbi:ETX/MTX2 family pore-forming toxin [Streptomyces sp. NPDC127084]|uniref:ETX/MTX2 family pore-forming toxin n=1 Tax=Streptomyces sp. NPDC127084 TaxID=3347133 RepID=UPI0036558E87